MAQAQAAYQVAWRAQAGPQTALIACPVFEVFFGGSRGGGKSDGMLGDWIAHADRYGEHAIGLMVRRERTQLIEMIERSRSIYSLLGAKYHEQDKMWRFPNGARLRFAYLERDADADSYQGHSYSRVYVEEIGTFPSAAPVLKLMATLRSGAGVQCGFRATGNPGGPGHQWVKARYIDPAPTGWKVLAESYKNPWTGEIVKRERVYIPSRLNENRYLGSDYVANLQMQGSPTLVKAWLEGDWSVIEGAFFPEWSTDKHVVAPFAIPDDWLRFRSADWGSAAPFSVGWWAVVGDEENRTVSGGISGGGGGDAFTAAFEEGRQGRINLPRGALIRYREWYGASAPNVGLKLPAEDVADGIKTREIHEPRNEHGQPAIAYSVLDPSAFASDGGPSIAERMATRGVLFRRADNARVSGRGAMGGWDQLRSRLIGDGERPMIYFFSTCKDAIRTLPALQHDQARAEDVDSDGEDHCFVAGTLVDTDCGPIPIERLVPGKHAIWSGGRWRLNYDARLTRFDAKVVRLTFDTGLQIVCTPDHRFMDFSGEWRYAKDLQGAEVSCDLSLSATQSRNWTAFLTTIAVRISSAAASGFIARYGKEITGLSRRDRTSIIRMAIDSTMRPTTWSALRRKSIWAMYTAKKALQERATAYHAPAPLPPNGTAAMPVGNGTANIMIPIFEQLLRGAFLQSVKSAAAHIWLRLQRLSRANSVAVPVKPVRCVSVEGSPNQTVYCLTEPVTEAFTIHGGMIVHNCADEIRYACMSRPYTVTRAPKPEAKILGVGPHSTVTWDDIMSASKPKAKSGRI